MKRVLTILGLVLVTVLIVRASTDEPYGPVVVYRADLIGLSGNISATTIYTPTSTGWYVVHGDIVPTGGVCNSIALAIDWTNGQGSRQTNVLSPTSASVHAVASNPIQYETSASGAGCTYTLNLEVVKE